MIDDLLSCHMIDTVCFSVQLSSLQFENLRKISEEHVGYINVAGVTKYRIVKGEINVSSYDSLVTFRCEETYLIIQFQASLPKQLFGNNVQLLQCNQIEQALMMIEKGFRELIGSFPSYKEWTIDRIDMCYAWRFKDQATALEVLRVMSLFDYPRKRKSAYPNESVNWSGRAYTVKFYLKYPEYQRHDFKGDPNNDLKFETLKLSEGVLRFEISFHKRQFPELFYGKNRITYRDLLDEERIIELLNRYKNKLIKNLNPKLINDKNVIKKLKQIYPRRKAIRLYGFYKQYHSSNPHDRQILQENNHQTTLWRNNRDLTLAGIGIHSLFSDLDFSLDIPSPLADVLLHPAKAGGCV